MADNTLTVSSTNTTSLYGGQGSAFPAPPGDIVINGDLEIRGCDLTSPCADFNLLNVSPTTINFGGNANLNMGKAGGTTTLRSGTLVGTETTQNAYNSVATTLNIGGTATTLNVGAGTGTATIGNPTVVGSSASQDLYNTTATTLNIGGEATALNVGASTGTLTVNNPDVVGTNTTQNLFNAFTDTLNIGQGATTVRIGTNSAVLGIGTNLQIEYDQNNNRLSSPQFESNSGNETQLTVKGPNDTTSAQGTLEVFNKEDMQNGKFISLESNGEAGGNAGFPFAVKTGTYTANVLSASSDVISFIDGTTRYATLNPAGPTDPTDLVTKSYVDSSDDNTTYTINAGTNAGGADLNLVGSDASTDTILYASGTGISVVQTDANTITTSLDADINDLNDVDITAGDAGDLLTYDGADWINSKSISGNDSYRFTRATGGTGSNAMFLIRRTRTGGNAANFQGPWFVGEYGADNLTNAPIASMNFLYQTNTASGNVVRFTSHPGTTATSDRIAQFKRGDFSFYKDLNTGAGTTNVALANIATSGTTITGTAASQISVSNGSGSSFQPIFILERNRTNNTVPNDGDRGDFRIQISGSTTEYNIGKVEGVFNNAGNHELSLNVYDGTAGPSAISTQVIKTTRKETTITHIPPAGGAPADVATFNRDVITFTSPVQFPSYIGADAPASGLSGQQISISDSTPGGKMAYWDTTNSRWSYVSDDSAV